MVIHIRHGDACYNKDRFCHSFDEYLKAAIEIRNEYGIKNIYLSTDADDIDIILKTIY